MLGQRLPAFLQVTITRRKDWGKNLKITLNYTEDIAPEHTWTLYTKTELAYKSNCSFVIVEVENNEMKDKNSLSAMLSAKVLKI